MYELAIIFVTTKFTNNHFIFSLSSFSLFFISRRIITIIKIINIIARRGLNKLFRARIHIAIVKTTMNSRRKTHDLSFRLDFCICQRFSFLILFFIIYIIHNKEFRLLLQSACPTATAAPSPSASPGGGPRAAAPPPARRRATAGCPHRTVCWPPSSS